MNSFEFQLANPPSKISLRAHKLQVWEARSWDVLHIYIYTGDPQKPSEEVSCRHPPFDQRGNTTSIELNMQKMPSREYQQRSQLQESDRGNTSTDLNWKDGIEGIAPTKCST